MFFDWSKVPNYFKQNCWNQQQRKNVVLQDLMKIRLKITQDIAKLHFFPMISSDAIADINVAYARNFTNRPLTYALVK